MTENKELTTNASPQAEREIEAEEKKDTTPNKTEEILIPVKFNKEIKNLTVEQASELAQKGMKFDAISEYYETLKNLASKSGKNVSQFLEELKSDTFLKRKQELAEQYDGNEALAEHIARFEENVCPGDTLGFEELNEQFPEIKRIEELPEQVVEKAKLNGRALLDEYLRYRLAEKKRINEAAKRQKASEGSSLGSQVNQTGAINPETAEFLKGLWR